ncbi:MAG: hypothetical protein ACYTBJ_16295 [Planctomycetota bacterium]|jgi:hypothetical protein
MTYEPKYLPVEYCGYCGLRESYTDGIGDVGCVNRECKRYGRSRSVDHYEGPLTAARVERLKMHEWADCHWADVWLLREIARYAIDDLTSFTGNTLA